MTSEEDAPDDIGPPRSAEAQVVGALEEGFHMGAVIGTAGMIVTGGLFGIYVVFGGILTAFNSPLAPPNYLSMTSDPWFFVTGTIVSTFVLLSTASRILYRMLMGVDDSPSQLVLILNYVGLGSAAGVLRFLLPPTIDFLVNWL